jgi:hypothetical protein
MIFASLGDKKQTIKVIEFYILLRFPPTGQNWQGGLG